MKPRHSIIELNELRDACGCLSFAQEEDQIAFSMRRVFMLYDIPAGTHRGGHAHRGQHQLLLMMSGACTVFIYNGEDTSKVDLDRPNRLLHAPPMLWLELRDFTGGAVCAVLASGLFDEADYIRDYAEFRQLALARS